MSSKHDDRHRQQTVLNLQKMKLQQLGILDPHEKWAAPLILLQGF